MERADKGQAEKGQAEREKGHADQGQAAFEAPRGGAVAHGRKVDGLHPRPPHHAWLAKDSARDAIVESKREHEQRTLPNRLADVPLALHPSDVLVDALAIEPAHRDERLHEGTLMTDLLLWNRRQVAHLVAYVTRRTRERDITQRLTEGTRYVVLSAQSAAPSHCCSPR